MAKKAKPDFRPTSSHRSSISQVLQITPAPTFETSSSEDVKEPTPFFGKAARITGEAPRVEAQTSASLSKPVDSRRKKLAHLKTLLEYGEKKDLNDLLYRIGNEVGHTIHFSIFNRGLLQAALSHEQELLRAAQKYEGLERPSNCEIGALRHYEKQIF